MNLLHFEIFGFHPRNIFSFLLNRQSVTQKTLTHH